MIVLLISSQKEVAVKNTIESDFCNHNDNFEKQTFISKIAIYDDDKNLLGIAKLATPVRKKETDLLIHLNLSLISDIFDI